MKRRTQAAFLLLTLAIASTDVRAQSISLRHQDAVVWGQDQEVRGHLDGSANGILHVNQEPIPFDVEDGAFRVPVRLTEAENVLVACAGDVCSDTLHWMLGYVPRPEVELTPEVAGRSVDLTAHVISNPLNADLSFSWRADPENPSHIEVDMAMGSVASITIPEGAPPGEYYFEAEVTDEVGRRRIARTFVTVDEHSVRPFDIGTDHASWIDEAILYEIAPWYFARNCADKFACIEDKIPEIASLGVTTIWLQPIYPTVGGGQAYDVTDYFGIWSSLGDEESLRSLIQAAKNQGLRVMFDFVPNHSSIGHPYAQDAIAHGETSHYWDFYMREYDSAPYSNNYRQRTVGEMTFVYYFWEDLVTFNLQHEETQRYLIEAARYWIEEFDIDGYRIDAVWAPHARNPEFMHEWRLALKRVKPEILLLAEDKAPRSDAFPAGFPSTFENFDVAYDWSPSSWCISAWAWEWPGECNYYPEVYGNTGPKRTIFNYGNDGYRAINLRNALTNDGDGYPDDAKILRFMENNDTPRFINHHSLAQTRTVAALLFALDGIPMLYYGQESGMTAGGHPYPTIGQGRTIRSYDSHGLWPYYQHLIDLRTTFGALTSPNMEDVAIVSERPSGRVHAFRRWEGDENIIAAINLGSIAVEATLSLPVDQMAVEDERPLYLTDLLTGDYIETDAASLAELDLQLPGHSAVVYAIADSVIQITVDAHRPIAGIPAELTLRQNYPNPVNDLATIVFEMPNSGEARLDVYDVLGRRVATLHEASAAAGRHEIRFDARGLASGTYIYRLTTPSGTATRQMVIVR